MPNVHVLFPKYVLKMKLVRFETYSIQIIGLITKENERKVERLSIFPFCMGIAAMVIISAMVIFVGSSSQYLK